MNNIIANFDQILRFAKNYGLPLSKKRGILREYLQAKILELLYQEKLSRNIFFIGGTSLRILHGLNRFSEDLDFDLEDIKLEQIDNLMDLLVENLQKENLQIDFLKKKSGKRRYYDLRFKNLLYELEISAQKEEKLAIKFDFENICKAHKRKVVFLNKYGFLVNIVSIPLGQFLVQKLGAYTERKQTQPRDIYDIVWLISQGAEVDWRFAKINKIERDVLDKAKEKFISEKNKLVNYKRKLRPFLVNEDSVEKLKLLPQMLAMLK